MQDGQFFYNLYGALCWGIHLVGKTLVLIMFKALFSCICAESDIILVLSKEGRGELIYQIPQNKIIESLRIKV